MRAEKAGLSLWAHWEFHDKFVTGWACDYAVEEPTR